MARERRAGSVPAQGAAPAKTASKTKATAPIKTASKTRAKAKPLYAGKPGSGQDSAARASLPRDRRALGEVLLTRRGFLYGAAAVGAAAAVGVGTYAATGGFKRTPDVLSLEVSQDQVFTTEQCEYLDDASQLLTPRQTISLPYGSMVWATDPDVAATLLPTDQGSPLTQVGLISLGNGAVRTILESAVGAAEGYEIYDARATSSGLIWTEADILDGNWRIYQAAFSGDALGQPVLVHEAGPDWEMPTLTAGGDYAFWQVLPVLDGAAAREDSLMMCTRFGAAASDSRTLYTSHGRMACSPSPTATGIAFAPRADTADTRYQLTQVDAATGEVTDALTLPASMKPIYVAYGPTGFSFSFDGIYSYGDGIANLGTYTPVAAPAYDLTSARTEARAAATDDKGQLSDRAAEVADAQAAQSVAQLYSAADWFRFPRTPVTPPCWYGDWFVVKSTSAVAGVNVRDRRYFTLEVENGAPDYGEFLASYGTAQNLVTYTNIDYTPINGDPINECRVKVWESA